jgi:hypothetical protein
MALSLTLWPRPSQAQETSAQDLASLKAEIAQAKKSVAKAESDLRRNDSLAREEADRFTKTQARLAKEKEARNPIAQESPR